MFHGGLFVVSLINYTLQEPLLVGLRHMLRVEQGGQTTIVLLELCDALGSLVGEVTESFAERTHFAQAFDVVDASIAELHLCHGACHASHLSHESVVELEVGGRTGDFDLMFYRGIDFAKVDADGKLSGFVGSMQTAS